MTDIMTVKAIAKGLLTYIPGVVNVLDKKKSSTKHSGANAEFCYTLWLSLLEKIHESGVNPIFERVGELGCGGSVGVGICALLTGTKQYFALEIENHFDRENNLKLLDEIVTLFKNKTPISPNFKQLNIHVTNHEYPSHFIIPKFMEDEFVKVLRNEINSDCIGTKHLNIVYDWQRAPSLSLDLAFSRAVMEHVNNPNSVYEGLAYNLKPKAFMFHDIEFHSHGITKNKNGHLQISNLWWKIIVGKRSYYQNRLKFQDHINLIEKLNFTVIHTQKSTELDGASNNEVLIGATIFAKSNKV